MIWTVGHPRDCFYILRVAGGITQVSLFGVWFFGVIFLDSLHHEQSTVQSRVRRLIGRRRGGGLDRYVGMFQREAAPLQDNVDPITELLSQLSGWWSITHVHSVYTSGKIISIK